MDNSLTIICDALKKIFNQLKVQNNALSFILLTGKIGQGKTALLNQSQLTRYSIGSEYNANLFYNQNGVILELGETWLNQSENLLASSLKQLNRCHKNVKISGILLAVDSSDLLFGDPSQQLEQCKLHNQLLNRFGHALGYAVDTAIIITKLDTLAGFCEFFQFEHAAELKKPLGFSLEFSPQRAKLAAHYKVQFDRMIEVLGQQIIHKLHPARSSLKRTLIREFPLQLTSLRIPIQALLQNISPQYFKTRAIYFASAEQGGLSIDQLNKKIQHEYSLTVQDRFPQATNYRAYFIEGALLAFQQQTMRRTTRTDQRYKLIGAISASCAALLLAGLGYQHFKTSRLLDAASKELLAYETLINQSENRASAFYHLTQAEEKLGLIPSNILSLSAIERLKAQLHNSTQHQLHDSFLPELVANLENVITNPSQSQPERYQALKIYLMLAEPEHFSEPEIITWFNAHQPDGKTGPINDKELFLIKNALKQPFQPLTISRQLVTDTRNYLNALPAAYLYYSLAKNSFPQETQPLKIDGFDLASKSLPVYYTKEGFKQVFQQLPQIAHKLQQENWVLARQDLANIQQQLEEAYCFDYMTWWQNFSRRTQPHHYQGYEQARQLTQLLYQNNAIASLVNLIQQNTSPDVADSSGLFNQKIANKFTSLSLMSDSASKDLTQTIHELEKFITTLSLVDDHGQTVFNLTRARFQGDNPADPLSAIYARARQLPDPVAGWAKQIADDTWFIFINESKEYLNTQWRQNVYNSYIETIAHRYPLDSQEKEEVTLADFNQFFAPNGKLNTFVNNYLKPFLDTSHPQWTAKEMNGYVLPFSPELLNELIRANVISNMFFPDNSLDSKIEFSLQKINLDPVVSNLQLTIGSTILTDTQGSDSYTSFIWPQAGAKLSLNSIEGEHFELEEQGPWAFFKMLQKVNVLVDNNDSASLQILFEVNGNSGRYLLKTQNQINPFSPGILTGFNLSKEIV
ncbi:type IVB secretion system protein IcmF [Legionella dresdenensis]|uniref:Type IVB secretion system protein IcmF n=1 Tax=Legionella dresdenensis TaxID=450200 RepID=A0ABV8CEC6_9GAMM